MKEKDEATAKEDSLAHPVVQETVVENFEKEHVNEEITADEDTHR